MKYKLIRLTTSRLLFELISKIKVLILSVHLKTTLTFFFLISCSYLHIECIVYTYSLFLKVYTLDGTLVSDFSSVSIGFQLETCEL